MDALIQPSSPAHRKDPNVPSDASRNPRGSITDSLFHSAQGLITKLSIPLHSANDPSQPDAPFALDFSRAISKENEGGSHSPAGVQHRSSERRASDPTEAERRNALMQSHKHAVKRSSASDVRTMVQDFVAVMDPLSSGSNSPTTNTSVPIVENPLLGSQWVNTNTLKVFPGANLPKIAKAVPKGTTIMLSPGEYKQTASVRLSQDELSLVAERDGNGVLRGEVKIVGDASDIPKGPLLNVSSPNATVCDITLLFTGVERAQRDENDKLKPVMVSCMAVTKHSKAKISNLEITCPNARGIEIRSKAQPTVTSCTIKEAIIGIGIADDAAPHVESCVLGQCASLSVQVSGRTKGVVTACRFESAGDACICAGGEARTVFLANKVLDTSGCGAIVGESSLVTLDANVIDGSHVNGIQVGHRAKPTVKNNTIVGSKGSGIVVYDTAAGLYVNNKVSKCKLACVGVRDKAEPHLMGNTITDGFGSGVVSVGSAEFVMEENVVQRHAGAGMKVQGMSKPLVDNNRFSDNQAYGVWVQDESTVTLQNNVMDGNVKVGLLVSHLSEPTVCNNVIRNNKHTGVILQNFAGGEFKANTISGNGANVQLLNSCNALFEGNTIQSAPGGGVLFRNETTCTLRRNMLSGNGFANMAVMHSANPTVEDNDVRNGTERGIHIHCEARGFFSGNRVTRNSRDGIFIGGTAAPTVTRNTVECNGGSGITVSKTASGRVADNTLHGNRSDVVSVVETATTALEGNLALPREASLTEAVSKSDGVVMIVNPRAGKTCIGDARRGALFGL